MKVFVVGVGVGVNLAYICNTHDADANEDGAHNDEDGHGRNDASGEHGPRWNPQLDRFAERARQLAHTVVALPFQWTEVKSLLSPSCHDNNNDNCDHRAAEVASPAWL